MLCELIEDMNGFWFLKSSTCYQNLNTLNLNHAIIKAGKGGYSVCQIINY